MSKRENVTNWEIRFLGEKAYYTGEVKEKKYRYIPNGYGTAKLENGDTFVGTFSGGDPVMGNYTWANKSWAQVEYTYSLFGKTYTRSFGRVGLPGYSYELKESYSNGNYKGECNSRKERNGIGEYTFSTGELYEGGWLNGKKHGIGKYTYADGDYDWSFWDNDNEKCVISRYRKQTQDDSDSYSSDSDDYDYSPDYDSNSTTDDTRPCDENFDAAIEAYNRGDYVSAIGELDFIYFNSDYSSEYTVKDEYGMESSFEEFREEVDELCDEDED